MISEDDGNNYLNKYPQESGTCQTEGSSTGVSFTNKFVFLYMEGKLT